MDETKDDAVTIPGTHGEPAPPEKTLPLELCREVAARVWCDPEMQAYVMDVDCAEQLAQHIHDWSRKSDRTSSAPDVPRPPIDDDTTAARVTAAIAATMAGRLNEVLAVDPRAVTALLETRVPCVSAVATEACPAVPFVDDNAVLSLGPLGLINAFLQPTSLRIVAHYNANRQIISFSVGGTGV